MKLKAGGFGKIVRIGKDDPLFPYRKALVGAILRINHISSRAGPWMFITATIVLKDITFNGIKLKKGDEICLTKVFLKSFQP